MVVIIVAVLSLLVVGLFASSTLLLCHPGDGDGGHVGCHCGGGSHPVGWGSRMIDAIGESRIQGMVVVATSSMLLLGHHK